MGLCCVLRLFTVGCVGGVGVGSRAKFCLFVAELGFCYLLAVGFGAYVCVLLLRLGSVVVLALNSWWVLCLWFCFNLVVELC